MLVCACARGGPCACSWLMRMQHNQKNRCKKSQKRTPKASQKPPKMTPKSDQKTTKNRCKKRSEKRSEIRPSWGCLGAILGHFRSPLGVIFVDFSLVFKAFRENSLFSKKSFQEPSWTELGSICVDFCLPNGSKMAPKTDQKSIKKHVDFLSFFLSIFVIFGARPWLET